MTRDVLMIATLEGLENCAATLSAQLGSKVEVANTRRTGLEALRRMEWGVIVVEESLAEADPEWADQVWSQAGSAMPLQVNFAISGCARLGREIRAALDRRNGEKAILRRLVTMELEEEFKSNLTGLLLQSELVMQEPTMPLDLQPKLRHVVELAGAMRERLDQRQRSRA